MLALIQLINFDCTLLFYINLSSNFMVNFEGPNQTDTVLSSFEVCSQLSRTLIKIAPPVCL